MKLLQDNKKLHADEFSNASPYVIMFGPDKCGATNKVTHFMLNCLAWLTEQGPLYFQAQKSEDRGVRREAFEKRAYGSNCQDYFSLHFDR